MICSQHKEKGGLNNKRLLRSMNNRFDFTDAAFKDGMKIPGTELITASIELHSDGAGGDNPQAKEVIESILRTTGAILSMHGTSVYDDFLAHLDELRNYVNAVCSFTIEDHMNNQTDMFSQTIEDDDDEEVLN